MGPSAKYPASPPSLLQFSDCTWPGGIREGLKHADEGRERPLRRPLGSIILAGCELRSVPVLSPTLLVTPHPLLCKEVMTSLVSQLVTGTIGGEDGCLHFPKGRNFSNRVGAWVSMPGEVSLEKHFS